VYLLIKNGAYEDVHQVDNQIDETSKGATN